jgi:sugar-specific transcriptional regulator TrmB
MTRDVAVAIVANLKDCINRLNESIVMVMNECSEEELRAFRRGVGHVMSEIHDRLSDPIFREHPDLIPPEADYIPHTGPTLAEIGQRR